MEGLEETKSFGPDIADEHWTLMNDHDPVCVTWDDEKPPGEEIIAVTPM